MDEAALIEQAKQGDLDSFNRLVLAYQTSVFNVAYRIMGDSDSAADAAQDAFISAYKKLQTYRGGSFKSWLFRIATNACYDELRRRKRRPAASLDALMVLDTGPDAQGEAQLASDSETPEAFAERSELSAAIQNCLNALPDEQRMVVVLSDVQGMDYSEVAAAMQVALGTVKSRIARARAKLRDCLSRTRELLPASMRLNEEIS